MLSDLDFDGHFLEAVSKEVEWLGSA